MAEQLCGNLLPIQSYQY